jgi:hypothetical protein
MHTVFLVLFLVQNTTLRRLGSMEEMWCNLLQPFSNGYFMLNSIRRSEIPPNAQTLYLMYDMRCVRMSVQTADITVHSID